MLIKCKACGKDMSKQADKCPSCGDPNVLKETKEAGIKFLLGVLFFGFLVWWFWPSSSKDALVESEPVTEKYIPKVIKITGDSEVEAAQEKLWAKQERELEENLMIACSDIIQKSLKYPSSYSQPWSDIMQVKKKGEGDYLIRVPFDAKNSLGNELPQVGFCVSDGKDTTLVQIENR